MRHSLLSSAALIVVPSETRAMFRRIRRGAAALAALFSRRRSRSRPIGVRRSVRAAAICGSPFRRFPRRPIPWLRRSARIGASPAMCAKGCSGWTRIGARSPCWPNSFKYDDAANTLTVKLRQGITFHSGAPLTSDDVVASLKRYAGSAGTGAVLKSLVNDISADGPDSVVFKLAGPTGVVPGLLTLTPAVIMSKASLAGASPSKPVVKLDCTGPYKLTEL